MTRYLTALAAMLALICFSATALAAPISADSLARYPDMQSVSMSPDGKQLSAIIALPDSNNSETALATWNLEDMSQPPEITPSGDKMKFIAAASLKSDRVLVIGRQEWTGRLGGCGEGRVSGATRTFVSKAYLTDDKHKKFKEAFARNVRQLGVSKDTLKCLELAGEASLVDNLPLDPHRVIVQQLNSLTMQANYYLYDLRDDSTELLITATSRISPLLFDPKNGKVLAQSELKNTDRGYEQRVLIPDESGEFKVHEPLTTLLRDRHTVNVAGIDQDSGKLYVLTDQFSDQVQARMYDPKTRKFDDEPLVAHEEFSISGLVFGRQPFNFNQLLGFSFAGPDIETVYVDPEIRAIHEGLQNAFPDQNISIMEYTDQYSKVLFSASSHRHPPTYHILNDKKAVENVGSQRSWIDSDAIGEQRWVTYAARDGLEIPAILDLPAGWSEDDGPVPAVVHPHGGPWARDFTGWDASGWVPFLTSRGYAVLRPQYRGSAGLGRKLWLAGDAEWGQKMQDDLDDAAKWLTDQNIASKENIVIFGYSYGGFAAAAATVRPDGPFKCAISGAPVTDLGRLGRTWSDNRLQRILQGRTVRGMDPIQNTDKANIPVLLYVGDRDVRTPSWHAENFYKGVKDNVRARLELIPDMPHSMPWYPRHQTATLGLIEDFLKNECGIQPQA
ncbi:MAG TPA: prolyl oligopeptidase family serine peptidase [Wenzhouxiangella sp.]|nr:prolyl oligopeptidase family serine peptidase [Wenzhouxiangella sp.]